MGSLTESTLVNAKNMGAANKRRPRRNEGEGTERSGEGSRAREGQEGRDEPEGGEENNESETEDVRRAMAEVIRDMERSEEETEREHGAEDHAGNEGRRGRQTEGTGPGPPTGNEVRREGVMQVPSHDTLERNRGN